MFNALKDRYFGTVLICGSAPCLYDDYRLATKFRPTAMIIAVNDASRVIPSHFIATLHPERAEVFKEHALNPDAALICGGGFQAECAVDYWFKDCGSGATSGYSAIRMAKAMGFDEIILCGCPMNGGDGYAKGMPIKGRENPAERFGTGNPKHAGVRGHIGSLLEAAKVDNNLAVRSMSGRTAELFGVPNFVRDHASH